MNYESIGNHISWIYKNIFQDEIRNQVPEKERYKKAYEFINKGYCLSFVRTVIYAFKDRLFPSVDTEYFFNNFKIRFLAEHHAYLLDIKTGIAYDAEYLHGIEEKLMIKKWLLNNKNNDAIYGITIQLFTPTPQQYFRYENSLFWKTIWSLGKFIPGTIHKWYIRLTGKISNLLVDKYYYFILNVDKIDKSDTYDKLSEFGFYVKFTDKCSFLEEDTLGKIYYNYLLNKKEI